MAANRIFKMWHFDSLQPGTTIWSIYVLLKKSVLSTTFSLYSLAVGCSRKPQPYVAEFLEENTREDVWI